MDGLLRDLMEAERLRLSFRPESLSDVIYAWNLQDFLKYADGDCPTEYCVGVSELIYCSNKYWLRRKYPELVIGENLYAAWSSFGRLIHSGVQQLLKDLGFVVEKEVSRVMDVNGLKVTVKGRLDGIGYWKDKLTVVEIKSSRSDNELPREQHILQLRIYMNLAGAKQGILLYITPDRLTEYSFDTALSDHELKILVEETIENKKHPRYSWECQYCQFNMMCPWKQTNNNKFYRKG